jgi:hypothetical protein
MGAAVFVEWKQKPNCVRKVGHFANLHTSAAFSFRRTNLWHSSEKLPILSPCATNWRALEYTEIPKLLLTPYPGRQSRGGGGQQRKKCNRSVIGDDSMQGDVTVMRSEIIFVALWSINDLDLHCCWNVSKYVIKVAEDMRWRVQKMFCNRTAWNRYNAKRLPVEFWTGNSSGT